MKRGSNFIGARSCKRQKLQQSIKSMLLRSEPKFVEGPGLQPVCRFCKRKFLAPQGLVAHLHMHERAGDEMVLSKNQSAQLREPQPQPLDEVLESSAKENLPELPPQPAPVKILMTRRFTVSEKLRIIDKFKETKNTSETCR